MNELRISDKLMMLHPDAEIALEHVNTAVTEDVEDSYSLPVSVPVRGNEEALGFTHLLSLKERAIKWEDALLTLSMGLQLAGVAHCLDADNEEASLAIAIDGLVAAAKKVQLRKIPYDLISVGSEDAMLAHAKAVNTGTYPEESHCFPMHFNKDFYGDRNPAWYPEAQEYQYSSSYSINDLVEFNVYVSCSGGGTFIRQERYKCISAAGVGEGYDYTDKWKRTAYGIINHWDFDAEEFFRNTDGNFYALVPFFYLKWILVQAFASIGFTLEGSFMDDVQTNRAWIYNNTALDSNARLHFISASQTSQVDYLAADPKRIIAQDDSTAPKNQDPDGVWNTATGLYKVLAAGQHMFRFEGNMIFSAEDTPMMRVRHAGDGAIRGAWQLALDIEQVPAATTWAVKGYIVVNFTAADVNEEFYLEPDSYHLQGLLDISLTDFWVRIWLSLANDNNYFAGEIDPRDHMPDITLADLIQEVRDNCCVEFRPDRVRKTVRVDYKAPALRGRPADSTHRLRGPIKLDHQRRIPGFKFVTDGERGQIPDLSKFVRRPDIATLDDLPEAQAPNEYIVVRNTRQLFCTFKNTGGFNWNFLGYYIPDIVVGEEDEAREIAPKLAPIMVEWYHSNDELFLMPTISEAGNSYRFIGNGYQAPSLRMGLYHGMVDNGGGKLYPFASSYGWGPDGTLGPAEITLALLDEPGGLFDYRWEEWANALVNAEPVAFPLEIDAHFINGREHEQLVHLQSQNFLIERIPATYRQGQQRVVSDEVLAYKLSSA